MTDRRILTAASVSIALTLLVCGPLPRAFAACSSAKCTDVAAIETARGLIQEQCGCTRDGQKHSEYTKCVKSALKGADITALVPSKPCRNLIMRCEATSLCGKPGAAVCCSLTKSGAVKSSVVRVVTKCKKGVACGEELGFYSKFDACDGDGTCAGPRATTTTTTRVPATTIARPTTTSSTSVRATTTSSSTVSSTPTTSTPSTTRIPTTTTVSGPPTTLSTTTTTMYHPPGCGSLTPDDSMPFDVCTLGACEPGQGTCQTTTERGETACRCK